VRRTVGVYEVKVGTDAPRVLDLVAGGVGASPVRDDLVDGVLLHLDDLDLGSAPVEVVRDLDTVAQSLIDGVDDLDRDRRVDVLRARERIRAYAKAACGLTVGPS